MIKEIIDKQLVELYFQPIVSIRSKKIFAFEALTRCTYKKENIPPALLFNLAKENNLSLELDTLTRELSIKKFKNYYLQNNDLVLFLNFEPSLINSFDENIKDTSFIDIIDELAIPYKNFMIEIKEDEISNTVALEKFCKKFKDLGFSIALDDFGTGSSTFDRVNTIRPNLIKIDRSLFKDVKNNHINKEILKAIAKMSHNLGIRVLAEGVEDEDAICVSMKSSINLFQGYYFCKPAPFLTEEDVSNIVNKVSKIGTIFRKKTIDSITNKRNCIKDYCLIADNITKQFNDIYQSEELIKKEILKFDYIEASYIIDAKNSKQINDTVLVEMANNSFKPTRDGEEHYLKEYYYITLESKQGIYLSQKYISYATGNICKTFAKKFDIGLNSYIICLDIIIKRK